MLSAGGSLLWQDGILLVLRCWMCEKIRRKHTQTDGYEITFSKSTDYWSSTSYLTFSHSYFIVFIPYMVVYTKFRVIFFLNPATLEPSHSIQARENPILCAMKSSLVPSIIKSQPFFSLLLMKTPWQSTQTHMLGLIILLNMCSTWKTRSRQTEKLLALALVGRRLHLYATIVEKCISVRWMWFLGPIVGSNKANSILLRHTGRHKKVKVLNVKNNV